MIDFSTEPYFDDFSEENKFYRILFRPSVAVQARELNQLQSILQNQIKKQGDHLFKNGAVVIPGEFSINPSTDYVKLVDVGTTVDITNLIGMTIKDSNGLQAIVTHAIPASGTDSVTLYVSYINAATSSTNKVFGTSATLTTVSGTSYTVTTVSAFATGFGTLAIVQKGVYYVNGFFVLCDKQTIVIDKYNISYIASTLSTIVGFNIIENEFTSDDIGYESLLDNAQGTNNYGAPGANRYFIDLVLTNVAIGSDTASFIELGRIIGNNIVYLKDVTEYNVLDKTLARRTYDQAGNYTVKGFDIDVREHRNNNRGAWNSGYTYFPGDIVTNVVSSVTYTYVALAGISAGGSAPTHTTGITNNWQQTLSPRYNRGIYPADTTTDVPSNPAYGDATKLAVGFSPGKAYVQGYEIEKISTNYINVPKPRTTAFDNNTSVSTSIGQYVQVTNVYKMPDIQACPIITLYDGIVTSNGTASGTAIGTCRVRGVQYDGTGTTQANTPARLYLFDIKMNTGKDFSRNVKSFYSATGFTANVSLTYSTILSGGITVPSAGTAVTGTGGTLFTSQLVAGDYIYYYDAAGVQQINKVASIGTNQTLTLTTTTPSSNVPGAGTAYYLVQTQIFEPNNKALVFPLPHTATTLVADHIYWVIQPVTTTGVVGNTLNISTSSGTFESDISNYFVQDNSTFLPVAITAVSATSSTAALTFAITPNTGWTVYATVRKTGTTARKTKTATTSIDTFAISTNVATKSTLTLSHTDCYKIVSIISGGADITTWYTFNTGQTDSYYDYSSLTLQPAYPAPTADVVVTYQYYAHSSGDFFDVGSYPIYDQIPFYNGKCLRDVIDFRPTIDLMSLRVPKRGYNMSVDLTYYMPRIDKIALSSTGVLFDIQGSSSMSPTSPDEPSNGMTLCSILMAPYVFSTDDVIINKVDNKRYTMRDIGSLEKRIDNLEYYTSLSLLEQETKSLSITDSTGLERFKNGFIVDSFTGHNVGNVLSPDYLCSVDMQNGELRPFFTMNNVNLVENKSTDAARLTAGYKLYGDVITLPVKEDIPLVTQQYASRLENINPFAIFTFLGNIRMNPSSDDWFETARRPDIIRNVEGNFNTIAALATQAGILGTVWNAWQILWMGQPLPVGGSLIQYTTGSNWANARALGEGATYINVDEFNQRFGGGSGGGPARQVYVQTSAQQIGRGRTGVKSTLAVQMERQVVDDKVVSTAVIPYIRSRNVLVQVKGLKPNTTFYPYFDSTSVSPYCTPASYVTYSLTSGTDFDISKNCGNDATDPARIIDNISGAYTADANGNMCLNTGDRIKGGSSNATAVVIGKDYTTDSNGNVTSRRLHIVNIKGTFTLGETITAYGTGSGATATISGTMPTNNSQGSALTTNSIGDLNFVFFIPDNDSMKFRTGTREFKLLDVATIDGQQSSSAKVQYQSTGILETRQQTINSIRNAHIIQEIVAENDTVTKTIERVARDTGWYDPLAQTFLVQSPGGAFLSKIDIFFATKDSNLPVTLEIREVVNGYPGKRILPFSKVTLNPIDVHLSDTTVAMTDGSGSSYPKYDTPTTFTFPSPVYVQDGQEYAIVLASDSNNYKVWISQMGDIIPNSSRTISEQPYAGVLFKSQNASTWTANQDQDLKFTIYRCKFDTDVIGAVPFVNDVLPLNEIDSNPFQTAIGTNKVRVWHRDHGMFENSKVVFDNTDTTVYQGTSFSGTFTVADSTPDVVGVGTSFISDIDYSGTALIRASDNKVIGIIDHVTDNTHLVLKANTSVAVTTGVAYKLAPPVNGIPVTEIYTAASNNDQIQHTISDVDLDSYCITVTTNADTTGYTGGSTVRASHNILFDVAVPSIQAQNFSDTKIDLTMATTSGKSVDGGETPYTYGTAKGIVPNNNNIFYAPQVVASTVNQTGAGKTVTLTASISSTNNALTPIIDTHRTSLIAISNKINTPSESNINVSVLDNRTVFTGATGAFSFANVGSAWSASAVKAVGDQVHYFGNLYTVTIAGTTGGSGPTHTVGLSANGTATLLYAGKSSTITSTNAAVCALIPTISVGKYITISGSTTAGNDGTYLVTGIAGDGSTTGTISIARTSALTAEAAISGTTVTLRTLFVDEIAPVGSSSVNKYISRAINLANPSNFFRVRFAGNIPNEANVLVYYKTSPVGSTLDLDQINWTLSSPDAAITKVQNGDGTFTDIDYSEEGLAQFDSFAIKIVMQSTNSSAIPRIKDLRIIACA